MTTKTPSNRFHAFMDPYHVSTALIDSTLSYDVWKEKYAATGEENFNHTVRRVVNAIYADDPSTEACEEAYDAMTAGLWMPAGRIIAGAGTGKRVTLMNCFVTGTIEDSMEGIMTEHTNFALTMQQGGGDGADFSPIRPENAILTRTGTKASGPLPFMDMWDSMCSTIRSAGDRRGAMMGVISDTHPDMPKVIVAKRTKGRLTNFNLSILVSDAFMEAVREDEDWLLYFHVAPVSRDPMLEDYDFVDDNGTQQYVYAVWQARKLWELITTNTYEWSEPGIIFIDRVNEANNLWYCEDIRCTNPCGEQPLPPHGACNLGHINLARMVTRGFTDEAVFDFELLAKIVAIGVRFLDNVIDISGYPLYKQYLEQQNKRRIGLGITGLADAMAQLQLRYGGLRSAEFAEKVQMHIALSAYKTSIELAKERGSFKLFDAEKYLSGESFVNTKMPKEIRDAIAKHGIRNGVINTIAPTGTTSCVYGNVSGGIEPVFAHFTQRNVLQGDGSYKPYKEWGYAAKMFKSMHPHDELPSYMVTADELTVHEHIAIQSRVQRWVDASISKTINIPKEMPYAEFAQVYDLAYTSGCKGCTTYRPSDVRGAILQKADGEDKGSTTNVPEAVHAGKLPPLRERPNVLLGHTYQIKWPNRATALYLTINVDENGIPFEILISSKDGSYSEWTTALSLMITAIFRRGGDVSFVAKELEQIQSMRDGAFINQRYVGSLPAYIGQIIGKHIDKSSEVMTDVSIESRTMPQLGEICPSCSAPTLFFQEGCKKCGQCGFSECG